MNTLRALLCSLIMTAAENYVENLFCGSGGLTMVLTANSSMSRALFAAVPPVPTLIFKADEAGNVSSCAAVVAGTLLRERTIYFNYTLCDVRIIQPVSGPARASIPLLAKPAMSSVQIQPFTFGVHCDYASSVTADSGVSGMTKKPGGGGGEDHGNTTGTNVPGLIIQWEDQNGRKLDDRSVIYVDDEIHFVYRYQGGIYEKLLPTECFLAGSRHGKERISFVMGACPATCGNKLISYNLQDVSFVQRLHAFAFSNYQLWAHCNLALCVQVDNLACDDSCFNHNDVLLALLDQKNNSTPLSGGYLFAKLNVHLSAPAAKDHKSNQKANSLIYTIPIAISATLVLVGSAILCVLKRKGDADAAERNGPPESIFSANQNKLRD